MPSFSVVLGTIWCVVAVAAGISECDRDPEEPVMVGCTQSPGVRVSQARSPVQWREGGGTFKRRGLIGDN